MLFIGLKCYSQSDLKTFNALIFCSFRYQKLEKKIKSNTPNSIQITGMKYILNKIDISV